MVCVIKTLNTRCTYTFSCSILFLFLTHSLKSHTTWLFSLMKMTTLVYISDVSGDFKCNFSLKNHFCANPFVSPPKSRKLPRFSKNIFTLLMYLEGDEAWKNKSRWIGLVGQKRHIQLILLSVPRESKEGLAQ